MSIESICELQESNEFIRSSNIDSAKTYCKMNALNNPCLYTVYIELNNLAKQKQKRLFKIYIYKISMTSILFLSILTSLFILCFVPEHPSINDILRNYSVDKKISYDIIDEKIVHTSVKAKIAYELKNSIKYADSPNATTNDVALAIFEERYDDAEEKLNYMYEICPENGWYYYFEYYLWLAQGNNDTAVMYLIDYINNIEKPINITSGNFVYKALSTFEGDLSPNIYQQYKSCLSTTKSYVKKYELIQNYVSDKKYLEALEIIDTLHSQGANENLLYYDKCKCLIGMKKYHECDIYLQELKETNAVPVEQIDYLIEKMHNLD